MTTERCSDGLGRTPPTPDLKKVFNVRARLVQWANSFLGAARGGDYYKSHKMTKAIDLAQVDKSCRAIRDYIAHGLPVTWCEACLYGTAEKSCKYCNGWGLLTEDAYRACEDDMEYRRLCDLARRFRTGGSDSEEESG